MKMLRKLSIGAVSALLLFGVAAFHSGAFAQEGPGGLINPGRDCQSITTCRFAPGGSYRGCLSSYSCRVCRFVRSACTAGNNRGRSCHRVRCTWG
ncbi:hypothetical protein W911_17080 [Hyphomicrobium nitrativorans NL23]|uniref:Secreted protein n=1 Tax=Hyphomicrobium nitrativorans NL23 TaxID=1029756 RepID=V5SK15_9HYPH|nr:hypothetical protein [Hyphomicrobium nitrativorans]AHB50460.1 hypothetical protein W911_17080 [Hyphomicrobium nitrativorans NL23]